MPVHKIGILAIHGDVAEHAAILRQLKLEAIEIRTKEDFKNLDGLILPGGESTTIFDLAKTYGLVSPLRKFITTPIKNLATNNPKVTPSGLQLPTVLATCAGLILLAKLKLLDVKVERNAYGRQLESFEAKVKIPAIGKKEITVAFIRAPKILSVGKSVKILAKFEDVPVLVRQGEIFGMSFHPEITSETALHKFIFKSGLKSSR